MLHSYSQEQVHGLENWPTSLLTPWQSKKVDKPLPKPSEGKGARTSMCKSTGPTTLQVWLPERFPYKGCLWGWWLWPSTITMLAPRGQDCNRCQRDQRPLSPQFPSPSLDCGFESNRSSLSMLSRSDRSDGSQHPRWGRWHQENGAHMKINLPVLKDKDAQ